MTNKAQNGDLVILLILIIILAIWGFIKFTLPILK